MERDWTEQERLTDARARTAALACAAGVLEGIAGSALAQPGH